MRSGLAVVVAIFAVFGAGYTLGAIIGHEQSDAHLAAPALELPPVVEASPEGAGCRRVSFFAGGVRVEVERDGALFLADPGEGRRWLMLPVGKEITP